MSKDKIILNFHDSLLKQSDIDLLTGPYWLNDTIISFYFEYLEKVLYEDEKKLLFVSPEVTQCLKMISEAEVVAFLDPLEVKKKDFIFFALNDNESTHWEGGSHWSLLVYSQIEKTFYHFDSMHDHNYDQAQLLYCNLANYLEDEGECGLTSVDTLQQINGYDCGIHVLCNVDILVKHVLLKKILSIHCPKANPAVVSKKRQDLLSLILSLSRS